MDALSYGLANQLTGTGVAVNILAPAVFTEAVSFSISDPDLLANMESHMAMPDPYGEAVAWLAEQPTDYSGNYLTNADLAALGALVER
jgi:hypothetical protein